MRRTRSPVCPAASQRRKPIGSKETRRGKPSGCRRRTRDAHEDACETREAIEARIAALTTHIAELNAQWQPHASVAMPSSQSELVVTGQFDPSRLLKKLALAIDIDKGNVELCQLQADLARRQLAELPDGAALEAAQAEAERAWRDVQERELAARRVYLEAKGRLTNYQERVQTLEAAIRQAETQATEWQRTAVKEQVQLSQAEKFRRSA